MGLDIGSFSVAWESHIYLPQRYPLGFDVQLVTASKPRHGGFLCKGAAICR